MPPHRTWLTASCAVYTQQWHVWFRLTVYLAHIGHDSLPDVLSTPSNDMSDFDWLFIWRILDMTHCLMCCIHSAVTCLISTDCLFGTYWTWLTASCAVYTQQWHVWFRLTVYLAHIGHDSLLHVLYTLSSDMSDFDWLCIWLSNAISDSLTWGGYGQ